MSAIKTWLKKQSGGGAVMISSEPYLRRLVHKLPWSARQWLIKALSKGVIRHEALIRQDADFDEVYELFHKAKPFPPKITGKCISSRHFDAAGTQTCQIMIEGRYNDILAADVHYIPVAADFSNIEQALEKFRDELYRTSMVKRTRDFILSNHTYVHRMGQVEAFVRAL